VCFDSWYWWGQIGLKRYYIIGAILLSVFVSICYSDSHAANNGTTIKNSSASAKGISDSVSVDKKHFAQKRDVASEAHDITHKMTILILQLGVILIVAKISGYLCQRYLRVPEVLGELCAGIIISPYALGGLSGLFIEHSGMAFTPELYGIATFASVILLFLAGLETDLRLFLKYSVAGSVVGIGGFLTSFFLGAGAAVIFTDATSLMDPIALFLGAISSATSVGITARVLSERNKLDSPEGVTILAGAVIDDILGIILLAIIVGMSKANAHGGNGAVDWGKIAEIAGIAFGFWIVCTAISMLLAKRISKLLEMFHNPQTMATIALGLALLLAGLAEAAGLAMIIGAYIMGLAMSRCDSSHELLHNLEPVYNTVVSVFFVVLGMMVDLRAMEGVIIFGLIYSALAIVAKMVGCGVPAYFMKFNLLGAIRVGSGMLPRGEVALIIASIGLTQNVVSESIFGVAIMMTLITTIIAPLIIAKVFNEKSGLDEDVAKQVESQECSPISLAIDNEQLADFLISRIIKMFKDEECYVHQMVHGEPIYQIRKDDMSITIKYENEQVILNTGIKDREFARLMMLEAIATLIMTFNSLRKLGNNQNMRSQLMS